MSTKRARREPHEVELGGERFWCLDELTARYCYDEIYIENDYLGHGITLSPGDTVVDVGANIGLFPRYLAKAAQGVKVHAFEPVPDIYEALLKNVEGSPNVRCYPLALGERTGEASIHFFPKVCADSAIVRVDVERKLQGFLDNYRTTVCAHNKAARIVPKALRPWVVRSGYERLYEYEMRSCRMTTLSKWIADNAIEHIDLLKLDAENYEREVLAGIDEEHWPRIRQISMEAHAHVRGGEGLVEGLLSLLGRKGYRTALGERDEKSSLDVHMIYAIRQGS
jgi:FkbM family methyltransferase